MNTAPLMALPGTLLDGRSLAQMLAGLDATTLLLGEAAAIDDEVDRLAASVRVPAVWLGHSLGGIVALRLARRHPGSAADSVLLGANARAGRHTSEARRAALEEIARRSGLTALAREKLAPSYGLTSGSGDQDALATLLADQAEAVGLQRFEHQLGYARDRPGLLAPLHRLACPLLALSGESDALCPPAQSQELEPRYSRLRVPNTTRCVMPGTCCPCSMRAGRWRACTSSTAHSMEAIHESQPPARTFPQRNHRRRGVAEHRLCLRGRTGR